MATRNIKERLDELGQRLGAADFRAGEGLMNEANIRIFSYAPEEEMAVRHFIDLVNDNPAFPDPSIERPTVFAPGSKTPSLPVQSSLNSNR